MYERLLDRETVPSFEELLTYSGETSKIWLKLEDFLYRTYNLVKTIRFPYGKDYGWSLKYSHGDKHICDVFAENNAFTVFFRIDELAVDRFYEILSRYAHEIWKNGIPSGKGKWLNFRVLLREHLEEVKLFLTAKVKPKKAEE